MNKCTTIVCVDNKTFRSISNEGNGEVSTETIFNYQQEGLMVTAHYRGGSIKEGNLLGRIDKNGILTFAYQHYNTDNEFRTGRCTSIPEILSSGKLRYHESWEWTGGLEGSGESIIEEI